MSGQNVLITGTPRSGTTLTCHLLNKLPDILALHEPMRVKAFAAMTQEQISDEIGRFCDEQRQSVLLHKRAISKNLDGAVPDNPIGEGRSDAGLRKSLVSKGDIVVDKELSPDFMLVIKHNSAFTAVLETLVKRFPVFGVIRNPLATLASWSSVEFSASSGYARAAERLDTDLKTRLAAIDDDLDRQICLLDWFHGQFRRYLPVDAILRYE
ncbi:MAG: sulfotransferase, partial [Chloroflexota bacterium]|nr:sulfotransferase [Chloroflexota bacterium]